MSETKSYQNSLIGKKPNIPQLTSPMAQSLQLKLDYDQLTNCMRCGFCLPACPTFRETGIEPESPRGRIALMKAVADGIMEPDQSFQDQMSHCLGCRACEPACPADVKYGRLIEQARDAIEDHREHKPLVNGLRKVFFNGIFPHRSRLKWLGKSIAVYQKSGLHKVVRRSGALRLLPEQIGEMERILPDSSGQGVLERLGSLYPAKGEMIGRVALFRGCIMDVLFAQTNVNTVRLLSEAGYEVVIPDHQVCCGALHAHSGELGQARDLARTNIKAFEDAGIEHIVTNAGGCGASLVEYEHLLREDPDYGKTAADFSARVKDVSTLLLQGRLPEFIHDCTTSKSERATVTYQDSCHLRNVMKNADAPRQLIQQVANIQYIEMKEADRCCGSAGIYNVTQPEMAGKILKHKMEHAKRTEARYILTSNPGCHMQMKLGVEKHGDGKPIEVMHIADFLAERMLERN
ncbi:(Fe-S)-binding protein [Neobacillus mesonae]|nr:(Fe-S)-binding protein [Neobacillus mesonae]